MPAAIIAAIYGETGVGKLLILSQVILSLQLSFAVVPLVLFTCDRKKMGEFANTHSLMALAWIVTIIIAALNIYLLGQTVFAWLQPSA